MGAASSVVLVHSSRPQQDADTLRAIFPNRFQIDKLASSTEGLVLVEDNLTLLVVQSPSAKGTYSTVILEEDVIRQAAERAVLYGIHIEERTLSATTIIKVRLPGGAFLFASTSDVWKNEESRKTALACLLAPPVPGNDEKKNLRKGFGNSGNSRSQALLLSPLPGKMHRSMSLSHVGSIPIKGPPLASAMRSPKSALFPSIRTRVLEFEGRLKDFPLNTNAAVPVETDLFVGHLMMIMRPSVPEDDPYWNERLFSKKKRRVVLQMQGKLKYKPKGVLYAGMETSDPMRLGLLASGLCNLILKMSQNYNPLIHYSFGDDKEKPHICFPASTFFERLVVTPPGKDPPPMGEEFYEPDASAQSRKSYKTKIDWNMEDTYSMSFHSMYVDFPSWSVVRLPLRKDISLSTFWGKASASVVFYEAESDSPKQKQLESSNKYVLKVEIKHLGEDVDDSGQFGVEDQSSDADWSEDKFLENENGSMSTAGDGGSLMPQLDEDSPDDSEHEEAVEFFDTVQSQAMLQPLHLDGLDDPTGPDSHRIILRLIDEVCPCVIDMLEKKGKQQTVFAFQGREANQKPIFRTLDVSQELLGSHHIVEVDKSIFSPRLSQTEISRRRIGLRYAEALNGKASPSKLLQFQKFNSSFDSKFLKRAGFSKKLPGLTTAFVARALSDRYWVEEWGCITAKEIQFYRAERSRPFLRMSLSSVVRIGIPTEEEQPLINGFHFLDIETFGRRSCLMFAHKEERDRWLEILKENHPAPEFQSNSPTSFTNHLIEVDEPSTEFLQKSSLWDCNKRRILNCRKFSFKAPSSSDSNKTLELAEVALRKATALQPKGPNDADLIDFLNAASSLKDANAHTLNDEERLAFFMNVYHVMIMHAFLVLGPPISSLQWISYFNNIAYQCSDDIFSLAELEHNIIRAEMSYPSQFLSRFVLPKSQYPFAVVKADFRVNFALNCGSLSIPTGSVPVYKAESLEQQLEAVTLSFLNQTVSLKRKGTRDLSITLPRVCQWFAGDFMDGSTSAILSTIEPYLSEEKRDLLKSLWNEDKKAYDLGIWNVKFLPYIFECRFLTMQ